MYTSFCSRSCCLTVYHVNNHSSTLRLRLTCIIAGCMHCSERPWWPSPQHQHGSHHWYICQNSRDAAHIRFVAKLTMQLRGRKLLISRHMLVLVFKGQIVSIRSHSRTTFLQQCLTYCNS